MPSVKTVIVLLLLGKNSKNKFDKKYNTFDSALSKHFNFGEANRLKADFINLAVALQGDMVAYGNLLRSIDNCSGIDTEHGVAPSVAGHANYTNKQRHLYYYVVGMSSNGWRHPMLCVY